MPNVTAPEYTVREVAERVGVSVHTLRYYEHIGLIRTVARGENGHRRYDENDVGWLGLLTCLRRAGMTIQR